MSWKAGLSRYLPALRFFCCRESPSSKGVRDWYFSNYHELKHLNPGFPILLRTTENAMPAVTAELEWTTNHLLRFMIETGRFRNPNGTVAQDRIDAAKEYINFDRNELVVARFQVPNFDPEDPSLDGSWRDDPSKAGPLQKYISIKDAMTETMDTIKSGPNDEFERGRCALLMTQRVDLWCAGEKEVEMAVQHLYKLSRVLNEREMDFPRHIENFYTGSHDV